MSAKCSATCEKELSTRFKSNFIGCFIASGTETVSRTDVLPRHSITMMHVDTPLGPELLPPGLLSTMSICSIKGEHEEEQLLKKLHSFDFHTVMERLRCNTGASLENVLLKEVPIPQRGKDAIPWSPSLSADSYASISSHDVGRYEKDLSLVLYTGNPTLETELRTYADYKASKAVEHPYTLGRFAESKRYRKAVQLVQRNARMAMAQLAQTLGIEIALQEDLEAVLNPVVQTRSSLGSVTVNLFASPANSGVPASEAGRPMLAVCEGLSIFNHLFRNEFRTPEGPHYNCVAIYTDCGNSSCGTGQPVFPISPLDGVAVVHNYQVSGHSLPPRYTAADLAQTLPCGAPFNNETTHLSTGQSRFVSRCLVGSDGESVAPNHKKLSRTYMAREQFLEPISNTFRRDGVELRVLRHAASTV